MPGKAEILGGLKICFYFALWYALNALYNVYNKKVLKIVPIPYTLALVQLIAGCCWVLPFWITGLRKTPKVAASDSTWLLNLGVWHGMVNVAGKLRACTCLCVWVCMYIYLYQFSFTRARAPNHLCICV